MKKKKFLAGIILGSIAGYFVSKYLVSENGQRALESIKTIRSDSNNGGLGLGDKKSLISDFNNKTESLKRSLLDNENDAKDDEETTNIVFDEDDIKNTEDSDEKNE